VVQAAADVSLDDQSIVWYEKVMLAIICGSFAVSCLLSGYMCRWQLSPLRRITSAASKVSSMNLDERIALDGLPVELDLLGREFNDMLDRLEVTYARLRQYADNAAHELRGPVNRMQLAAEIALRRDGDGPQFREALEANAEEARRLARILDSVLFLARAENAGIPLDCKRVGVRSELESIRDYFSPVAEEKHIELTLACPADLRMWADRVLLQRAISNLIDNALSHTPPGGRIELRASSEHDQIVITVSDTGEGIPGDALPHVFDRFFRADGVRTAGRRVGLGLAITRSIVALHGGTIRLDSRHRGGTTARLSFSTAKPDNCSTVRRA
jgi:two-component system heavy metal sensor histidine kinase CusS